MKEHTRKITAFTVSLTETTALTCIKAHHQTKNWNYLNIIDDVRELIQKAEESQSRYTGLFALYAFSEQFEVQIPSFPHSPIIITSRPIDSAWMEKFGFERMITVEMVLQNVREEIVMGNNGYPLQITHNTNRFPVVERHKETFIVHPQNKVEIHEIARRMQVYIRRAYIVSAMKGEGFTGLSVKNLDEA